MTVHRAYPIYDMGAVMNKPDDIDEVTGLSLAQMEAVAEDLFEHRDEAEGQEVPAEHGPEIRSVVSMRFQPRRDRGHRGCD